MKPTVDPTNRVEMLGPILQEAYLQSRPAVAPYQKLSVPTTRPTILVKTSIGNPSLVIRPIASTNVNPVASTSRAPTPITVTADSTKTGNAKEIKKEEKTK